MILGVVQRSPSANEDEFDLSQHDGRNIAFQMKNKIVTSFPNNYSQPTSSMG